MYGSITIFLKNPPKLHHKIETTNKFRHSKNSVMKSLSFSRSKQEILKLAILICSLAIMGTAQTLKANKMENYQTLWREIEKLEKDRLPKSALEKVEQVFEIAKSENNQVQIIRSTSYKIRLISILEEDGFARAIRLLEQEMADYQGATLHYLHFLLGKLYNDFYQANRFLIDQRSVTHGHELTDVKTWDKTLLKDRVIKNLALATSSSYLMQTPTEDFVGIIDTTERSNLFFPTVFDVVAHNAISILASSNRARRGLSVDNSDKLTESRFLDNAESFVNLEIVGDTLSFNLAATRIYQNWLKHLINRKANSDAFVFADIHRLKFAESNLAGADTKSVLIGRFEEMLERFNEHPASAEIAFEIAHHQFNLGQRYDYNNPLTHQYEDSKTKAHTLLANVLKKFPDAFFAPNCINLKQQIENKSFSFQTERLLFPKQKNPIRISYTNVDRIHYSVFKVNYKDFVDLQELQRGGDNFLYQLTKSGSLIIENKEIKLPTDNKFNTHSVEFLLDELDLGFHVLVFNYHPTLEIEENHIAVSEIFVTNMLITSMMPDQESPTIYLLNRETGQPVSRANYTVYGWEWNSMQRRQVKRKVVEGRTTRNGIVDLKEMRTDRGRNITIEVSKGKDFLVEQTHYFQTHHQPKDDEDITVRLFTDRAIYRPGQTVHFKGIACKENRGVFSLENNLEIDLGFEDANWQTIQSLKLKTNDHGSFSGTFQIPLNVLPGTFTIDTDFGSHTIRVEEYKRPNFEVTVEQVEGEFRLNDSVTFKGSAIAFSGAPLTDAGVTYTITRAQNWWGRWSFWAPRSQPEEIAFGTVKLDEKGNFNISFKATATLKAGLENSLFIYTIIVNVTDINGETQSGSGSVTVSNQSLMLSSNLDAVIDKQNTKGFKVFSRNASGRFVDANVEVEIHLLKNPVLLLASKKWEQTDKHLYTKEEWYRLFPGHEYSNDLDRSTWQNQRLVLSKKINTKDGSEINLPDIKSWRAGSYRLVLKSTDRWGNKVEEIKEFTVFSSSSRRMPLIAESFFHITSRSVQPGQTVSVYVGSSHRNVTVFYHLVVKGKVEKREIIRIDNQVRRIEIPILESHRGGISVNLMFVKNGQMHAFNQNIAVDWLNKQLSLSLVTFRDKTLPGSHEEWKMQIADYQNNPAQAELLAAMYDASLDAFAKNTWSFSYLPSFSSTISYGRDGFAITGGAIYSRSFNPTAHRLGMRIPRINFFGVELGVARFRTDGIYGSRATGSEIELNELMVVDDAEADFMLDNELLSESIVAGYGTQKIVSGHGVPPPETHTAVVQPLHAPQVRANFNETAFFYPHLVANENGEVMIRFTMPESLTRWNFLGLAHTRDMKFGTITANLITQKELMVTPNLPRFFRESDEMEISARVSNISDQKISGKATIEFFDPVTLASLNHQFVGKEGNVVDFSAETGSNTSVGWRVTIPEGLSLVGTRIVAAGKNHSDGEERLLPILTNRMLVTETMPLPVRKAETTNFTMQRLLDSDNSSTLRHHSVTLEFTSNPAWYAVKALPYLMEYPYECSEQVFSRLYANMLAWHVANSNPKIKRVFESWKTAPDSKAFISNLEKNQELKSLLIEETPWVMQAKNESERKRRLGLLFDFNKMADETNRASTQLAEMQRFNGGWPWFSGMRESWHITQHIVVGFGKMKNLGVLNNNDSGLNEMVRKAVNFIDTEMVDSYNKLKGRCDEKCRQNDQLGYIQMHYLYGRSFFINEYPIAENASEAFNYYAGQAEEYWRNKGFYAQGMLAVALNRLDKQPEANKIIASLREHARTHQELGTFWNIDRGSHWHQAPIETHAMLMEAFEEVANDKKMVDDMKVWLLKQKQTQDWRTTKATTEAIYALLMRGKDILSDDDLAVIKLGDITIDPKNDPEIRTEAGTGYFKKSWHGADVNPSMGTVSITKKTDQVSWGALYWQYFEQLDKITHFEETPLKIDKKLFVERRAGEQKVIVPLEKDGRVSVGDRIKVRIEIRVDRDMEYVHLKDMRASAFEPVEALSGYRWSHGLGYYLAIRDASMNFFINYLLKGTYVFEYDLIASQRGNFSNGITTIQCMYAPEFTSHSEGVRVVVE